MPDRNDSWKDEGYEWEPLDSHIFILAGRLSRMGDATRYPASHGNERRQFDRVYRWLKSDVDYFTKFHFPSEIPRQDLSPNIFTMNYENRGTTPDTFNLARGEVLDYKEEFTLSITAGLKFGMGLEVGFDIPGVSGASATVNRELTFETGFENHLSRGTTLNTTWDAEVEIPPMTRVQWTVTVTKEKIDIVIPVSIRAQQKPGATPIEVIMNYDRWSADLMALPAEERTFHYTVSLSGGVMDKVTISKVEHPVSEATVPHHVEGGLLSSPGLALETWVRHV